jgi:hypothetical protein
MVNKRLRVEYSKTDFAGYSQGRRRKYPTTSQMSADSAER